MAKLLIKDFGHDPKGNIVVVFYSDDENELNDFVAFNPNKSLQAKNVIFKIEQEEPKHITVYINPFVSVDEFMHQVRESFSGEIYFTVDARQSYVSSLNHLGKQTVFSFEDTMKKETPIFGKWDETRQST